jgi:hypothetical protein
MVVLTLGVVLDLEDHGTQPSVAPANRTILLRVVVLLVDQVGLLKNLLNFFETDAMFAPNFRILP